MTMWTCSTIGKAEAPEVFFTPWLDRHGLGAGDALLIDDRASNCEAFTTIGGTAIQWTPQAGLRALEELAGRWLASPGHDAPETISPATA